MPPLIWQNEYPAAEALRPLAAAPSLTAALSARGAFSVRLLGLGETQDCAYFGGLGLPETLFCRRVLLCVDGCAVVEAESACLPQSAWREKLAGLGGMPLGSILFSGSLNGLVRSPLEFALTEDGLPVRRSVFEWRGTQLFLAERFLPDIWRFQAA